MTADQFLMALSKHWREVLGVVLMGVLASLGFAVTRPVLYESSSTVYVSAEQSGSRGGVIQSSHYVDVAVQSLAKVGTTPQVLGPVIRKLGLRVTDRQLAEHVSVDVGTNTVVLTVRALDRSAAGSARLANAVRASLAIRQSELSSSVVSATGRVPALTVHTVSTAQPPSTSVSPNLRFILASGVLAGLLLGLLYAVSRQLVRPRIASVAELRQVRGAAVVPFLGSISADPSDDGVASGTPSDEGRVLALHLGLPVSGGRVILVSGAASAHDSAAVARGIAVAAAERSGNVLLVDADLRRARDRDPAPGLSEVLQGTSSLQDVAHRRNGLTVLAAGGVPGDPAAVLGSEAAHRLVAQARDQFDLVVLAAPSVLAGPDALGLGRLADGAVLVVCSERTLAADLSRTVECAQMAGIRLLGIVLEQPRRGRRSRAQRSAVAPSGAPDTGNRAPSAVRGDRGGRAPLSAR